MQINCPLGFKVDTIMQWIGADDLEPNIQQREMKLDKPYVGCKIMNTTKCIGESNCPIFKGGLKSESNDSAEPELSTNLSQIGTYIEKKYGEKSDLK